MIYFVQLDSGAIKIGSTEQLNARLLNLAWHYQSKVSLLGTLDGGRETEREIHKRFAHLRMGRTEQFKPADDLLDFIGRPNLLVSINPDAVEAQPKTGAMNCPKSQQVSFRFTPETLRQIEHLSRLWGPVKPLSTADVIIECIRRAIEAEARSQKKS